MINGSIERIELTTIPYEIGIHPGNTSISRAKADLRRGMNCQLFTGIVLDSLGKEIPKLPRSLELWEDVTHTAFLNPNDTIGNGDIIFLTDPREERDPMWYHVGVLVVAPDGTNWITHNSKENGFAVLEKLEDAMKTPIYGRIAGVKRAVTENPNGTDHAFLEEMGLGGIIA